MIQYNNLPLFEAEIIDENDGIKLMSIVGDPAVQSNFLKFKNEIQKYSIDNEKRIITGVALRANYPIYRNINGGCYLIFKPESIEKISQKYMKEASLSAVNIDHENKVDGIYLIESFILSDRHSYPEFEDVENGSWITSYKVENDEVWQDIKDGKLNGFSVEILSSIVTCEDITITSDKSEDDMEQIIDEILKEINN